MLNRLLFISNERSKFLSDDFVLPLGTFEVVGIDYASFLDLRGFVGIILDKDDWILALRKVNLGIRDDKEAQTLWNIVYNSNTKTYFLCDENIASSKDMLNLGISYVKERELPRLLSDAENMGSAAFGHFSNGPIKPVEQTILTADDIRGLHQDGITTIPAGAQLTEWAREVATTLKISELEGKQLRLFPLKLNSKKDLKKRRTEIFDLASDRNLYFVINPLYIASFNLEYPVLKGRTVASGVHWASHGAFTGEVSAEMLKDLGCFGAVLPFEEPYIAAGNLEKLVAEAKAKGLRLFSTFKFANGSSYDIIQLEVLKKLGIIQIYEEASAMPQHEVAAILAGGAVKVKGM